VTDIRILLITVSERKRQLERPVRRWENNINVDLREIGGYCLMHA